MVSSGGKDKKKVSIFSPQIVKYLNSSSILPLTCVDAALLALLPRLVDDAHPHQRGCHDTCYHSDHDNAYGDRPRAGVHVAVGTRTLDHSQAALGTLGAQRVGHDTSVAASVLQCGAADHQKLVHVGEVVALAGLQWLATAQPRDTRRGASHGLALHRHRLAQDHTAVLHPLQQMGHFCRGHRETGVRFPSTNYTQPLK